MRFLWSFFYFIVSSYVFTRTASYSFLNLSSIYEEFFKFGIGSIGSLPDTKFWLRHFPLLFTYTGALFIPKDLQFFLLLNILRVVILYIALLCHRLAV
jgi:hypothetical protein